MNHTQQPDPLEHFSSFLRENLNDLLQPSATTFLEMLAKDAVIEFPYTPSSGIARVEGRAAIAEYVAGVGKMLQIDTMSLDALHRTNNPNVVIVEFTCTGSGVQTGKPYNQTYISVITLRDGFIAHYRDYWNPLVALEAIGGTQAIAAALRGEGDSHA